MKCMKRLGIIVTILVCVDSFLAAENPFLEPKQSFISATGETENKDVALSTEATPIPFLYLWNGIQQGLPPFFLFDPILLPPDLFSIPEEKGLSVSVASEKARYEVAFDALGRLALMPMFWAGSYTAVIMKRNSSALPINIELPDKNIRISVLEYETARPLRFQYEQNGERFFGVLHYWGNSADESWYTEAGEVKAVYEYTLSMDRLIRVDMLSDDGVPIHLLRFHYNAQNEIALMENDTLQTAYFYDGKNRLVRVIGAVITHGESYETVYDRNFQYDEQGRLIRQYGLNEEGFFEYRYQYTLDSRGQWIFCRVQPWHEQFGRLVPGVETTITRTFVRK